MKKQHSKEVDQGKRFEFGKNWTAFLRVLDEERIKIAEDSLKTMLEVETLKGKIFLDIGSGSGLFSLVATRLGASVHSFDYDPQSVACTQELKRRYFPECEHWNIEEGSVLDASYLEKLGTFDIVYSWGVLHHTGDMWQALENITPLIAEEGRLFIALYNDQGWPSQLWKQIKHRYCSSGETLKSLILSVYISYSATRSFIGDLLKRKNPVERYMGYRKSRGMSRWHDWVDWLGGYPFEVSKPEEIFIFFKEKGFSLERLKTCAGGLGCNEFIFKRKSFKE